jgi:hypothetical protein
VTDTIQQARDRYLQRIAIYKAEGRVHPVGHVTIAAAVDWFVSNGFRLVARKEDHLHTVAVLEKLG